MKISTLLAITPIQEILLDFFKIAINKILNTAPTEKQTACVFNIPKPFAIDVSSNTYNIDILKNENTIP